MRILITGATGFIGQNLMDMLQKQCGNVNILTLNRNVEKAQRMYPSDIYSGVTHTFANDWNLVKQFNPELVIHLASNITPSNDSQVIEHLVSTNITYGILLLDALSQCDSFKIFINTGSFAEYRWGTSHFDSAYLYAASKTAFRAFLEFYSDLYNFKYITAVPYSVYGGKPTIKRLIDYIMDSIESVNPIDMTKGEQMLDFIHVDDVASFFIHVIQNIDRYLSLRNGEEFHLGTGRCVSIRELTAIVEKVTGKLCNINWGGRPYRERDVMYAAAPIAKNIELVGWRAKTSLEQGVSKYIRNSLFL